jgi:hypothetical protein
MQRLFDILISTSLSTIAVILILGAIAFGYGGTDSKINADAPKKNPQKSEQICA